MGWTKKLRRYLTLLSAVLIFSCAPVEESDAPYDPESTDVVGGALATSPPTVASVSPTAAAQGSVVTITGTNFDSSAVVSFGELSGTVIARSSASLRVKVPVGATSGALLVTTSQGTAEAGAFGILAKISGVAPKRAYPGATVTLTGTGFTGATGVRFGEVSAPSFTVVSDTSITCVFPTGGGTSAPTVVKDEGSTTGSAKVTRIFGVSSFSPVRGPEGTVVTIVGGGFTAATSVLFGRVSATFTVVDDATIEATVPVGAPSASYLTINVGAGKTVSSTAFGVARAPSVTRFTPTSGTLPTTVRISGRNLGAVTSISLGSYPITDFQILNGLLIELTIPDTIPSVTAPFTLTTSEGSATTADSFAATSSAPGLPNPDFLWLDATDLSTLTIAGDGITVSQWRDKSGNSRDANGVAYFGTNVTPAGTPALEFNWGSLMSTAAVPTSPNMTIFVVYRMAMPQNWGSILNQGHDVYFSIRAPWNWPYLNFHIRNNNDAPLTPRTTNFRVLTTMQDGTTTMMYHSAADLAQTTQAPIDAGVAPITIGNAIGGGQSMGGNIAEIRAYSSALDANSRAAIEASLRSKYGIFE